MDTLSDIFDWVLSSGLRASVLVLFIVVAQRMLRSRLPARWRYALWIPALIVLLVPPALPLLPASEKTVQGTDVAVHVRPEWRDASDPVSRGKEMEKTQHTPSGSIPDPLESPIQKDAGGHDYEPRFSWRILAAGIWGFGSLAALLLMSVSYRRALNKIKEKALPVPPDLEEKVNKLAARSGLRRAPRILLSSATTSPAVCGFWQPTLLLNEGVLCNLTEQERSLVLKHELTHIRRGDLRLNVLLCGLLALHWPNPILWLAFFRARADREAACDADVLRGESAEIRAAYGHTLLKMADAFTPPSPSPGFVGIVQGAGSFTDRIKFIISQPKITNTMKAKITTYISLLALLGIVKASEPENEKAESHETSDASKESAKTAPGVKQTQSVILTYSKPIEEFEVKVFWRPREQIGGYLIGPAIVEFSHGDPYKTFSVTNDRFGLSDSEEWMKTATFGEGYFVKTSQPQAALNYVEPKITDRLPSTSFFFVDLNFDGKKELVMTELVNGQRSRHSYQVYQPDYLSPKINTVGARAPLNSLDSASKIDFKKRTIRINNTGGAQINENLVYKFDKSTGHYRLVE